MQQPEMKGMWGRYVLFMVLAVGILALNALINPPRKPQVQREREAQQVEGETPSSEGGAADSRHEAADSGHEEEKPESRAEVAEEAGGPGAVKTAAEEPVSAEEPRPVEAPEGAIPPRRAPVPRLITLGSGDPASSYRELVTATNLGAAVVRAELNSPRFRDLEDRSGYLGHGVLDEIGHLAPGKMVDRIKRSGCPVDAVGPGTPAARAGLEPGDLITAIDGQPVSGYRSLRAALKNKDPRQTVELTVDRGGKTLRLSATLGRRPLEVIRPEKQDPLSFLLTLRQIDDRLLDDVIKSREEMEKAEEEKEKAEGKDKKKGNRGDKELDETINLELPGLDLRTGVWEIEDEKQFDQPGPHTSVTFVRELPQYGLKIRKTFRLAQMPRERQDDADAEAYHLELAVAIENTGRKARQVAYQLDGPTGLPIEGAWYAYKVGRGGGLRDVVVSWERQAPNVVPCGKIADDNWGTVWGEQSMTYVGVDAQYFSAIMIPQKQDPHEVWFAQSRPLRVGPVDRDWKKITNTSCRLVSKARRLEPGQNALEHTYTVFAGPKKPALLARYGLKDVVYYGWFWWVAKPMLWTLHLFYAVVRNYGLAIIMLTVLVRGCMFPLSIKQTRGAQKMQELQPEIKKIHEKYKSNAEAKIKAQQELFKKHKYNPLSGCLIILLQLPIFFGLYRGLAVDVELRQAPLISESIRWCSNLAAPDMLYDWSWFWNGIGWTSINEGLGFFGLGPYFNLLPILTIALFLVQQKMFMPPPTDDQAKMQQTMMKFMMVFMGFIFYKVASGLCLYFIASSLWGVAERKLLPKTSPAGSGDTSAKAPPPEAKPKPRVPKPQKPPEFKLAWLKSVMPKSQQDGSNNHQAAGRKKKRKKKKKSRGNR